jgi:hypothetical protein
VQVVDGIHRFTRASSAVDALRSQILPLATLLSRTC